MDYFEPCVWSCVYGEICSQTPIEPYLLSKNKFNGESEIFSSEHIAQFLEVLFQIICRMKW